MLLREVPLPAVQATPSSILPGAPTGLKAAGDNGQAILSWTAPSDTGSSAITHYEYSSNDGTAWRSTSSTAVNYTALTESVAGRPALQNNRQYAFRVRAVNDSGNGLPSERATATPTAQPGQAHPDDEEPIPIGSYSTSSNGADISSFVLDIAEGGLIAKVHRYRCVQPDIEGVRHTISHQ